MTYLFGTLPHLFTELKRLEAGLMRRQGKLPQLFTELERQRGELVRCQGELKRCHGELARLFTALIHQKAPAIW